MATEPQTKPSFTPGRKWAIGLNVTLRTAVVLAVVVMANYLGGRYFGRFYLSAATRIELSSRTVSLLHSLTNDVRVTLYYAQDNPLYPTVAALLQEYQAVNPKISVTTVDYLRDATAAQRIKAAYKLGDATDKNEKNLVIFDCEGRTKIVNGSALAEYTLEQLPNEKEREYRRKPTAFKGEMLFTAMLLGVTNPKPLKAYVLQGHGEHRLDNGDEVSGYLNFAAILQQNYIQVEPLSLLGTNSVPPDCNLLIIPGPTAALREGEPEKIEQYLESGGRLLALFNSAARDRRTGLEKILLDWGVLVGESEVRDPDNSIKGADVIVSAFTKHPVVNPLTGLGLHMILPRSVARFESKENSADAPKVEAIAFSGPNATLVGDALAKPRQYPLAVAVEKSAPRGVVTERGATRIVVVGDSFFLGNRQIESAGNRDFVGYAANWLLDRQPLLAGLGPRPVNEYRITTTRSQLQTIEWLLLAALPGAALLLGGLVWLRRRK